jgi:hypothetical protein
MNENLPCVFKNCPNPGERVISLTTGPLHYIEDKPIAPGSIVFAVCVNHVQEDIESLAVGWDPQRVSWDADADSVEASTLPEHPSRVGTEEIKPSSMP